MGISHRIVRKGAGGEVLEILAIILLVHSSVDVLMGEELKNEGKVIGV